MSMKSFTESVKSLITENELVKACEKLGNFLKPVNTGLYNETRMHLAALNQLRRDERQMVIESTEARRQKAQIRAALLDLTDDAAERTARKQQPVAALPAQFEVPDDVALEKIFGVSHLKKIAWLEQGLQAARSVCRVVTPEGIGSGFMVTGGYLLTNYHVIPDAALAARTVVQFNYQESAGGTLLPHHEYRLDAASFTADADLDFAYVKIIDDHEDTPLDTWGALQLASDHTVKVHDHVSIIQHPEGGVKQIAITANQVVNIYEHRLHYTTDTLPGSSGSPVFNDAWQVIALHHAGGNLKTNKLGIKRFVNEGILIDHIIEALDI